MHRHQSDYFARRHAVIATMHGKERVIGNVLSESFGMTVDVSVGINTDQLGTFTREISRPCSQLDAARRKATLALAQSHADLAIASEGAFTAHPDAPFICQATEIVLLLDRRHALEIVGRVSSTDVHMYQGWARTTEEAVAMARAQDFPRHGIVVRSSPHRVRGMRKDIDSLEELADYAQKLLHWPWRRRIFLETDMRAHRNPTRMACIAEATKDLITRMQSLCPMCGMPGFGLSEVHDGLPCERCHTPTRGVREHIYCCVRCPHTRSILHPFGAFTDPRECPLCNP